MRDRNTTQSNNRLHSVLMHAYFVRHEYNQRYDLETLTQQGDPKTQSRRQRVMETAQYAWPAVDTIKNTLYNNSHVEPPWQYYNMPTNYGRIDRYVFDHFTPTHWRLQIEHQLFTHIDTLTLNALAVKNNVKIGIEWWGHARHGLWVCVRVTPNTTQAEVIDFRN